MITRKLLAALAGVLALAYVGCGKADSPPKDTGQAESPPADRDAGQADDDSLDIKILSKAFGEKAKKSAEPSK